MIFHTHRVIFFHPGKTAGTAIEAAFGYTNTTHPPTTLDYGVFKGWDPEHLLHLQHAPIQFMRDRIPDAQWESFLRVAAVRNPFDRLLSVYCFQLPQFRRQYGSFQGLVAELPRLLRERPEGMSAHLCPQVEFTHLASERAVDLAVRFDRLPSDWGVLRGRVAAGPVLPETLPRVNTATANRERRSPAEEYSSEGARIVQEVYALDFEAFGYPPEPSTEPEAVRLAGMGWQPPRVESAGS